ncbi:NagC family transcriptional regulator [Salinisphaera hydrothermalis C41B8]|uniref:NagC family transcriptional regulator n=1 Tax=Salinisphaera hydrothermalis (strain C41B8) TaxID=1304275 RepID=A0A084IJ64_SALHC|nr:NagC family transcriptional regulator [Salinisphaera hydrothermalis C41B8]
MAITDVDRQFFHHLIAYGQTSRAALSADIGISRPTASQSARRLLRADIIRETGRPSVQRGRVPLLYDVNGARGYTLSLALDHDWIGLRVSDLSRRVLWEKIEQSTPETTAGLLIERSRALVAEGRARATGECLAVTCSVADPVDPWTGQVIDMPNSPFTAGHIDVGSAIFELAPDRLHVDNDVHWAAFAESRIGLMCSQPNFLYVFIGAGIGSAIYVNGALYRGASGLAGEIGHARVAPGQTLVERLIELGVASPDDSSIDTDKLIEAFETGPAGDKAKAVINAIAWAIANTIITLNPAVVVFAGRVFGTPAFSSRLRGAVLNMLPTPIDIRETAFGPYAPLLGATLGAAERAESYLNLRH